MGSFRTTRRRLIAATAALPFVHQATSLAQTLAPGPNVQSADRLEADEPDADALMLSELNRMPGDRAITAADAQELKRLNPNWAVPLNGSVTEASWPEFRDAIDYAHLISFEPPPASFKLTAATLQWLAKRNSFRLKNAEPITIFGLRGCTLEAEGDVETAWAKSHNLRVAVPDHKTLKCLLGAWNRSTGQLRLFKGSTVPEAQHVAASRNLAGMNEKGECNLQPTGLYEYETGSHSVNGPFPQHGVLRQPQDQHIVVLRSPNDSTYNSRSSTEVWQPGYFANNLHSAACINPQRNQSKGKPIFFSAGCQIVAGSYVREDPPSKIVPGSRPRGAWATFRTSIGLHATPSASADGDPDLDRRFQYILLTGLEAALHANGNPDFLARYNCIRFGSWTFSNEPVGVLQRKLGRKVNGVMDATTVKALLDDLRRVGAFESGVVLV